MKTIVVGTLFLVLMAAFVARNEVHKRIDALNGEVVALRSERDKLKQDVDYTQSVMRSRREEYETGQKNSKAAEIDLRANGAAVMRKSEERESQLVSERDKLWQALSEKDSKITQLTQESAILAMRIKDAERATANLPRQALSGNQAALSEIRARAETASPSERALVDFIDSQLASGVTVDDVLADARMRGALASSKLAQDLVSYYRGRPIQSERDVGQRLTSQQRFEESRETATPSQRTFADSVKRKIENGTDVNDIIADPHVREAMKSDPLLRAVIQDARNKNGR